MNRDKVGTLTCYVHQHNLAGTLMYIHVCVPILFLFIFMQSLYYAPNFLFTYLSLIIFLLL